VKTISHTSQLKTSKFRAMIYKTIVVLFLIDAILMLGACVFDYRKHVLRSVLHYNSESMSYFVNIVWLKLFSEIGDIEAQTLLGDVYMYDMSNMENGLYWYRQAGKSLGFTTNDYAAPFVLQGVENRNISCKWIWENSKLYKTNSEIIARCLPK